MRALFRLVTLSIMELLSCISANAQSDRFGEWQINRMTEIPGAFASTVNNEGELFF